MWQQLIVKLSILARKIWAPILGVVGGFFLDLFSDFLDKFRQSSPLAGITKIAFTLFLARTLVWVAFYLSEQSILAISGYLESFPAAVIELTGLAGWFALHLRIPESFAIIVAGVTAGFIRKMMPGLK